MNSLREIVKYSPRLRDVAQHALRGDEGPQPLGPARWDWRNVRSVLVIRLRSIGDTVLTTPSLFALRRFLPKVRIDMLVEDWVAPVLDGCEYLDNVIMMKREGLLTRVSLARQLRAQQYDVVYNLHGGTTATLLTRATGARHRVGFAHYQYRGLHNHLAPSSLLLWGNDKAHSVEQQLALIGWTGVPVSDRPPTHLAVTANAAAAVAARLRAAGLDEATPFALIHPAASYLTKQWAADKFAGLVDDLAARGLVSVVITAPHETELVGELQAAATAPVVSLTDLSLPEVSALAARARLFVGNDSGIAHIAAAVSTPAVVIFGSSNVAHWRPWSTAPSAVVKEELPCQPCHGYFCAKFPEPECILRVPVARVTAAVERVLRESVVTSRQ
jgi:predicted lipopolysaccharide heptosyltransferase III